jgi:hypothetical protein
VTSRATGLPSPRDDHLDARLGHGDETGEIGL